MKLLIILLVLYLGAGQSSIYTNVKHSGKTSHKKIYEDNIEYDVEPRAKLAASRLFKQRQNDAADAKQAHSKARVLQKARTKEDRLNNGRDIPSSRLAGDPKMGKEYYHMDPVLNQLRRSNTRRHRDRYKFKTKDKTTSSSSSSSSIEMMDWKDEFKEQWLQKKFEAINSTDPRGDVVNMAAARPWGVPCGDPNQHDMPWGNCLLPMECDAEYRIYRGDYSCGRSQLVCCALQLTNYDLYQGFDVSFDNTDFETDSEEKKNRNRDSKERRRKRKARQKRKRIKERRRRKRRIRKNIKKIVREIRKILNRSYRNATRHRKKRTKVLKKYIKKLKRQYKLDRKSVRDIHTNDMRHIDNKLLKKLQEIRTLNRNFFRNETFRSIVVNGTINKQGARMLVEAYPELEEYLREDLRRLGGGEVDTFDKQSTGNKDFLEYDIEYGALYY